MPPNKNTKQATVKKKVKPGDLGDLEFLSSLSSEGTTDKDVHRAVKLFMEAREKKQKDVLISVGEALDRLCADTTGLMLVKEAGVVPTLAGVAADVYEAGGKHTRKAVDALCRGTIAWLDEVDPIDFMELSNLMYFAHELGGVCEDVAMASLTAIARFAHHRPEHAAGMLQAGVVRVLHALVSEHRSPEFVEEVFSILYLLCDLPAEAVYEHVEGEMEILTTVVEMLGDGPLNMRLQLAGFRLLGVLFSRLRAMSEETKRAIDDTGAKDLLIGAMQKLKAAGYPDQAAWLHVVAGRALRVPA